MKVFQPGPPQVWFYFLFQGKARPPRTAITSSWTVPSKKYKNSTNTPFVCPFTQGCGHGRGALVLALLIVIIIPHNGETGRVGGGGVEIENEPKTTQQYNNKKVHRAGGYIQNNTRHKNMTSNNTINNNNTNKCMTWPPYFVFILYCQL